MVGKSDACNDAVANEAKRDASVDQRIDGSIRVAIAINIERFSHEICADGGPCCARRACGEIDAVCYGHAGKSEHDASMQQRVSCCVYLRVAIEIDCTGVSKETRYAKFMITCAAV
jgi:hypothetical protein